MSLTTPTTPAPRYLSAKELAAAFAARGLRPYSYEAMIALIADCPESVGPTIRLEDAIAFRRTNPDWRPFARNSKPRRKILKNSETPGIVAL